MGTKSLGPAETPTKKGQLFCIASSIRSCPANMKVYGKVMKPGASSLPGVKKDLHTMH